ncbi:MAG: hypothetical protein RL307_1422, partial [Pseudomonadota bacterium]
ICRGNPYLTTLQSWKYVTPAILIPFMFVLDPSGQALLLMGSWANLGDANFVQVAEVTLTAIVGIVALAGGLQGWFILKTLWIERVLMIVGGLLLTYPGNLTDWIGAALFATAVGLQLLRRKREQGLQ